MNTFWFESFFITLECLSLKYKWHLDLSNHIIHLHCSIVYWQCSFVHCRCFLLWIVFNLLRIWAIQLKISNPSCYFWRIFPEIEWLGSALHIWSISWWVWSWLGVANCTMCLQSLFVMIHFYPQLLYWDLFCQNTLYCKWTLLTVEESILTNSVTSCMLCPFSLPKTMSPFCHSVT